jgi:DNA mismatch endonuclease (patch repair protein)
MSAIRAKGTKPEIKVRRFVYSLGYHYRLHVKDLPGKPDLVFKQRKKVIFVHGCFWHHHENCKKGRLPKSRQEYWHNKIFNNVSRDIANIEKLEKMGMHVLIIWECETQKKDVMEGKITNFLNEYT